MATIKQNLITRAKNIAAELAAMDMTKIGGLPNTKDADGGTTIDHVGYRKSLMAELNEILKSLGVQSIADLESLESAEDQGDFELETQLEL